MAGKTLRSFIKKILLLGNFSAALLLLAGCYGDYISTGSWLFGLLAMLNFYLLILLLAFLTFWLFVRPKRIFISLLAILAAWPALNNIILVRAASSFSFEKQAAALRVMSWNVEHFDILEHKTNPQVKEEMIALINEYRPDVACFQEMVAGDKEQKTINPLSEFNRKLGMEYHHYAYLKKFDFDDYHHFGIIIFSKYPIVKKEMINPLPENYNSIFQYVDILKGNDTVRIFNVHLQTLRFSADNRKYLDNPSLKDESDLRNSKNVLSKLKRGLSKHLDQSNRVKEEINKSPYPVVVCGDFNDVPNSYAFRKIGAGLKDAFIEKGSGMGRTYTGISPTLRIDYVFCDPKMKVLQYDCPRKKLSDHFPVVTDLELP